jgi:lipoprotein-anchoring transpeptidase ErfK/SrfK
MTPEEIAPISTEIINKRIDVNLTRQTLSCFEDDREVFFCRVSTGMDGEDTATPPGLGYHVWRKMVSAHMSGGTTGGGWDLAGVGFTTLFIGDGIAIHSTFWHNNFGEKTSRGCINVSPEHAKWIFRWSHPVVGYDPGDVTVTDFSGTLIRVIEQ